MKARLTNIRIAPKLVIIFLFIASCLTTIALLFKPGTAYAATGACTTEDLGSSSTQAIGSGYVYRTIQVKVTGDPNQVGVVTSATCNLRGISGGLVFPSENLRADKVWLGPMSQNGYKNWPTTDSNGNPYCVLKWPSPGSGVAPCTYGKHKIIQDDAAAVFVVPQGQGAPLTSRIYCNGMGDTLWPGCKSTDVYGDSGAPGYPCVDTIPSPKCNVIRGAGFWGEGTTPNDLTSIFGTTSNGLRDVNIEGQIKNTFSGNQAVYTTLTFRYPRKPADKAPQITLTPSCSDLTVHIDLEDLDAPSGFRMPVTMDVWRIDPKTGVDAAKVKTYNASWSNGGPYKVPMYEAIYNQFLSYRVYVSTRGYYDGGISTHDPVTVNTKYGPCWNHPKGEVNGSCDAVSGNVYDLDFKYSSVYPVKLRLYMDPKTDMRTTFGGDAGSDVDGYILSQSSNDGNYSFDVSGYNSDLSPHKFYVYAQDLNPDGKFRHWDSIGNTSPDSCAPISCAMEPNTMSVGIPAEEKFVIYYNAGKNGKVINDTDNYISKLTVKGPGALLDSSGSPINYDPAHLDYDPPELGPSPKYATRAEHKLGTFTANKVGFYQTDYALNKIDKSLYGRIRCGIAVVEQPYFSIFGNDVIAGGDFNISSPQSGYSYACGSDPSKYTAADIYANYTSAAGFGSGSGVQFAALALGGVNSFVSANIRNAAPTRAKGLTFANTANQNNGGYFQASDFCVPDYWSLAPYGPDRYIGEDPGGRFPPDIGIETNMDGPWRYNGNGGTGQRTVGKYGDTTLVTAQTSSFVPKDVFIRRNIEYSDSGWEVGKLPALFLVVMGNIKISSEVTRLDGVYIALPRPGAPPGETGNIITCTNDANGKIYSQSDGAYLKDGACNKNKLSVNGAFIARRVQLLRTINSLKDSVPIARTADTSKASEIFNFSPEIYLADTCIIFDNCHGIPPFQSIVGLPPVL